MMLGIGTGTSLGMVGGLFLLLNNTIYKSCLFLCAGSVERQTGRTKFSELGGLAGPMPWTFVTCLIAALAISGIPPLNGFASKWMIYQGIIDWGGMLFPLFLLAAMFGSALTLASPACSKSAHGSANFPAHSVVQWSSMTFFCAADMAA